VQQLRVQVESQALKEEIKEDLRERVEGVKQIGEEVSNTLASLSPLLLWAKTACCMPLLCEQLPPPCMLRSR
jgi:hypothetical protein